MTKRKGLIKAFTSWLSENSDRFVVKPIVSKEIIRKAPYLTVGFSGGAPEVTISIYGCGNIDAYVMYHGRCWDTLRWFDVYPRRDLSGGYYCSECLPEAKKLFRSRKELLAEHSFEPLLEWVNENFTPSRWVCLFAIDGSGSTWAEIVQEKDVNLMRSKEDFVHAFPLLKVRELHTQIDQQP
jgi:hypothetical protein